MAPCVLSSMAPAQLTSLQDPPEPVSIPTSEETAGLPSCPRWRGSLPGSASFCPHPYPFSMGPATPEPHPATPSTPAVPNHEGTRSPAPLGLVPSSSALLLALLSVLPECPAPLDACPSHGAALLSWGLYPVQGQLEGFQGDLVQPQLLELNSPNKGNPLC